MNIIKIYKLVRTVFTVAKIALDAVETIFQKDLNKDGIIGFSKDKVDDYKD